jgi:hypothetical protein
MKPQVGQKKHLNSAIPGEKNASDALYRALSFFAFAQTVNIHSAKPEDHRVIRDF